MFGSERPTSLKIVVMEPIEKRIPATHTCIQNFFPTFRCRMVFKVLQPSAHKRAEIKANVMFKMMINQSIFIPQVFSIKIYDNYSGI